MLRVEVQRETAVYHNTMRSYFLSGLLAKWYDEKLRRKSLLFTITVHRSYRVFAANNQCTLCGNNEVGSLELNEQMPSKLKPIFEPFSETLKTLSFEITRIDEFRDKQLKITMQRFIDLVYILHIQPIIPYSVFDLATQVELESGQTNQRLFLSVEDNEKSSQIVQTSKTTS